ncbi:MAG: SRPBCC family protein [Rhodothermales bacterium]|nr:SRPBCC family protein [Rhodothermales bacterium]
MGTFRESILIEAPREAVWAALADIGEIHRWNPGVHDSRRTSEQAEGVGATRYCDLGGRNYLDEEVVAWDPPERLTMRVVETNLPFDHADIHFTLREGAGGTVVAVSPEYALKYGPVGALLDRLWVRQQYRRGMEALLSGLKAHVERVATEAQR